VNCRSVLFSLCNFTLYVLTCVVRWIRPTTHCYFDLIESKLCRVYHAFCMPLYNRVKENDYIIDLKLLNNKWLVIRLKVAC